MEVLAGNIKRKSMGLTDRLDVIKENSSQMNTPSPDRHSFITSYNTVQKDPRMATQSKLQGTVTPVSQQIGSTPIRPHRNSQMSNTAQAMP